MYSRWWVLGSVIPVRWPTVQLQEQSCTQGGGFFGVSYLYGGQLYSSESSHVLEVVGLRECHICTEANCTAPRAVMYSRWWVFASAIPV
ncbi:hypothetical protein DPMN_146475 [Dreissena polymorpha]|uniref:Secreted protein n=1 Tax=Dreissena polymorpha TaxID=45954 RepID=A0A9D4F8P4_DREPO|nr:hypothetical protein DPMN_144869 [Dreissena polymorpha]KAH3792973.1 hypothetical protein DPMN_146475 [Dreissena polymorpha]